MNLLAIDTSSPACSVAVSHGDATRAAHREDGQMASRAVIGMIDALLAELELRPGELTAIAIGSGPGSFTGVRLGVSVAQGLGFALDKPLVPISSLAAVAQRAFTVSDRDQALVAQDARMGELYVGRYRRGDDGLAVEETPDRLIAPTDLTIAADVALAGDAWQRLPALSARIDEASIVACWPQAIDVLVLARAAVARGDTVSAENAGARYLRDSVVR
ncbi:MAG: tRNA (adenosine(37)-N6)-threonylcarbamoyltransferase complex dimerization subunit type 1 TsaB [Pseudomonadota bacterium]